jgi:hypothetical protein
VLLDMLVMKYESLLAERRLAVRVSIRPVLDDAQYAPSQHQAQANQQQKSDGDIHDAYSK